jgi:hypothetical protein
MPDAPPPAGHEILVARAGGARVLADALARHATVPSTMEQACRAVCNICADGERLLEDLAALAVILVCSGSSAHAL